MAKNLLIVESPTKVKTIEKYLGDDFEVKSSNGHIRDLVKKDKGINVDNNFEHKYEILPEKKAIIKDLKNRAQKAEIVYLASDEDREGEAIAWHLSEVLELEKEKTKRIVFNEITKEAIIKAINNPRYIDYNLLHAQQARRAIDRLVGFEVSPILWRKIQTNLSAGRVQSVAVRLIVEKEREINKFKSVSTYKVLAEFTSKDGSSFIAQLSKKKLDKKETIEILEKCIDAEFTVTNIESKPKTRKPGAPFTTSTLQQEASAKLGMSIARTMQIAQKLYELGHITYMRTDSLNLSGQAINAAKEVIVDKFGTKYYKKNQYKTKVAGAQEAHEAIRPTDFAVSEITSDASLNRLYKLIHSRALASQMADAILEQTTIQIKASTLKDEYFSAGGEVIKFDGFLKQYKPEVSEDEDSKDIILPKISIDEKLIYKSIKALEVYTRPPARYTEATLVRKLEELGIGRPSTYVPTISTIQKRGYIVKEGRDSKTRDVTIIKLEGGKITEIQKSESYGAEKSKLFPSDIGIVVTDFLLKSFPKIIDYNFTANVEKEFDEIAQGSKQYVELLEHFYGPFHKNIEEIAHNEGRLNKARLLGTDPKTGAPIYVKIGRYGTYIQLGEQAKDDDPKPTYVKLQQGQLFDTLTLDEAIENLNHKEIDARILGSDPKTGKQIIARIAKYGPVIQLGEQTKTEKPKYAKLKASQTIQTITLQEAIDLFSLPKTIGTFESKELEVAIGRFGPYVKHDKKYYSLPKNLDPMSITEQEAIEVINKKREKTKTK
ncbi:MAG: type I DNA topoisomerase [Solitalea-like symbiont of Tyrophagus putrescentiae]